MTARDELHQLIDALPESDLAAARRFLEFLQSGEDDPLAWVLNHAPLDDEPTTPEEDREAAAGWQEYLQGHAIPLDQIRRRSLA